MQMKLEVQFLSSMVSYVINSTQHFFLHSEVLPKLDSKSIIIVPKVQLLTVWINLDTLH